MATIIVLNCPFCGAVHEVEVDTDEFLAWRSGELIQNAMPDLSPTKREQFISQPCPRCQLKVFGE